jgi:hypothetical protein
MEALGRLLRTHCTEALIGVGSRFGASRKLGQGPLIRHPDPDALEGPAYGGPVAVYER